MRVLPGDRYASLVTFNVWLCLGPTGSTMVRQGGHQWELIGIGKRAGAGERLGRIAVFHEDELRLSFQRLEPGKEIPAGLLRAVQGELARRNRRGIRR